MGSNRRDRARYRTLSSKYGIEESEVKRIVTSFFEVFLMDARSLHFDNPRKIFSMDVFESRSTVRNIPYIGRLGPVYSRYLKWRENESKELLQKPRGDYRSRMTQDDIENIADAILSGNPLPELRKRKKSEMFERVWMVGKDGKRSARQVIEK